MSSVAEPTFVAKIRATVGVFVSLAGAACGITLLYLGMRAVMQIGGFCAEGGPFEIRQRCPEGIPGLMLGGIWGGIIFFALYVWQTIKNRVPSLIAFAWPALFLSLGWNFLEFGLNPPGPPGQKAWGWLICAILFGIMGGAPLLVMWKPVVASFRRPDEAIGAVNRPFAGVQRVVRRTPLTPTVTVRTTPFGGSRQPDDIVSALERLNALHESGALDDAEFEAAKQKLLEDGS